MIQAKTLITGITALVVSALIACQSSATATSAPNSALTTSPEPTPIPFATSTGTPESNSALTPTPNTDSPGTPKPTVLPPLEPVVLLERINAAMSAVTSAYIEIDIDVKPSKDADSPLLSVHVEAEGNPTGNVKILLRMDGTNRSFEGSFVREIIEVDGTRHTRILPTGEWIKEPITPGEEDPLEALLLGRLSLSNLEVTTDSLEQTEVYRVSGNLAAADPGATMVMWVDMDDMLARRMLIEEQDPAREYEGLIPGEVSSVFKSTQYSLSRFNEPVVVAAPAQEPAPSQPKALSIEQQVPEGWTRHTAHNFEFGLPNQWSALEVSLDAIDEAIEELRDTNPAFIPYLQALKNQPAKKFWAYDSASPPGIAVNLNVGLEDQLIPLEIYAQVIKEQYARVGFTLVGDQEYSVGGYEVLMLRIQGRAQYPGTEPFAIEVQQAIVDSAEERYTINLTYVPQVAEQYHDLLLAVVQTFRLVE